MQYDKDEPFTFAPLYVQLGTQYGHNVALFGLGLFGSKTPVEQNLNARANNDIQDNNVLPTFWQRFPVST